ncbi:MAG: tetratricopeptide repeat protein [Prevotella sp.]|nr:tetratricopeptide repeat protein [Prevotella sp.]
MLRRILLILVLTATAATLPAQTDRQYVRNGNKYFLKGDFKRADLEYRKALSLNKNNTQALYNRGCANMQENPDSALLFFMEAGKNEPSKIRKAMAYHNIGWMYHSSQKYDEAIEAYKEALRNNPADDETRYNLQLAMWQKKKNQEQNGGGQNQDQNKDQNQNKDNQDQNKNNQDQNKDNQDQNKDNQDQDKQDQDKDKQDQDKDQDSKGQPAQTQQISDDNAERLLDAATQQEKRTQDRINKALQQPRRKILQKNW